MVRIKSYHKPFVSWGNPSETEAVRYGMSKMVSNDDVVVLANDNFSVVLSRFISKLPQARRFLSTVQSRRRFNGGTATDPQLPLL